MSSVPYLTLVSKQCSYVHVNYHQSSFHFIKKFFHQSNFHLIGKKLLLSIQLLFDEKNIFHQCNFYLSKDIFSWIPLLITETIIFINPASIESKTLFNQSSFHFKVIISNNLAT